MWLGGVACCSRYWVVGTATFATWLRCQPPQRCTIGLQRSSATEGQLWEAATASLPAKPTGCDRPCAAAAAVVLTDCGGSRFMMMLLCGTACQWHSSRARAADPSSHLQPLRDAIQQVHEYCVSRRLFIFCAMSSVQVICRSMVLCC